MFNLENVNFANLLFDLLKSLLATGIVALVTYLISRRYFKHIDFAKKMKKNGFDLFAEDDQIDFKKIFTNAKKIRMLYVSAYGFFMDEEKIALVEKAAEKGVEMQFLISKKNTTFIKDIEQIEIINGIRGTKKINDEIEEVTMKINEIKKKFPNALIQVRYFSTEYRMPLILADFEKNGEVSTYGWLNLTFPPKTSRSHILLRGKTVSSPFEKDNFFNQIEKHFDEIWSMSSKDSNN